MAPFIHFPCVGLDGRPIGNYQNAIVAVQHIASFKFDEMAQTAFVRFGDADDYESVSDRGWAMLRQNIIDTFAFDPNPTHIRDAGMYLAYKSTFNPLLDYLGGLVWDKHERLAKLFPTYCGADDTKLSRFQARRMFAAAAGRIFEPGLRCDAMMVLIGPQRAGKSTLLRLLARDPRYFTDQNVFGLSAREFVEAVTGKWLIEGGELDGLNSVSVERIKALLSRTHDRARPAYGRNSIEQPRRFVFFGTTNQTEFLRDTTGNRRFWIQRVERVDFDAIQRDRDQLWAEAVYWYRRLEVLDLPASMQGVAADEQELCLETDPWDDRLAVVAGKTVGGEERVAFAEVWDRLGIPFASRTHAAKRRVVDAMRRQRWSLSQKPFKLDGRTVRGFVRPK